MQLLKENIDFLIAERDVEYGYQDQWRKKIGNGWGCGYLVPNYWTYDVMTTCCIAFPLSLYVLLNLKKNNVVGDMAKYLQVCQNIASDFICDIGDNKLESSSYIKQPFMNDLEPSNHAALYICLVITLYNITGDKRYFLMAERLAMYIKFSFRAEENDTICWPYRGNMIAKKTNYGERYWKSIWVVYAMLLCYKSGCCFNDDDMQKLVNSVKFNLIRNNTQIYDSLSRTAGVLVDQKRLAYHASKDQLLPMSRLINFSILAIIDSEVIGMLEAAISANEYYRYVCENFTDVNNFCVLEGLTCLLDYSRSVLNISSYDKPYA
jgi:hypothetical protein